MNTKLLFFFLLFWSVIMPEYSEAKSFPDYPTVLNQLLQKYNVKDVEFDIGEGGYVVNTLDKRMDGWHWTRTEFKEDNPKKPVNVTSALFWSAEINRYLKLNEAVNTAGIIDKAVYNRFINSVNEYERMYFRISPCYGYTGWEKDVIKRFEKEAKLSDSSLYMLARAYSFYAGNLILDYNSPVAADYRYELKDGFDCLTPYQLAEYRKFHRSAINAYERLEKQNPDFETIIGNVSVKIANEHVTAFLYLCMVQNEAEALKELENVRYPESLLKVSRNYLMSCKPDAVLITNGDNDTFPLLYLQAKENYRTDITVVNVALLNTTRYIEAVRNQQYAKSLAFFSPSETIKEMEMYVSVINTDDTLNVSEVLQRLEKDTKKEFNTGTLVLSVKGYPDLLWTPSNKSYWLKAEMMILDILEANQWKRPFYFSQTVSPSSFFGLEDYFCTEGVAYRLKPDEEKGEGEAALSLYTFNPEKKNRLCTPDLQRKLLTETFHYPTLLSGSEQEELNLGLFRQNFIHLSLYSLSISDSLGAKKMLDKSNEIFPDKLLAYDYLSLVMAEMYYQLKETDKANNILALVYKNIQTSRLKPESFHASILNLMKGLTDQYHQKDFFERLKNTHRK